MTKIRCPNTQCYQHDGLNLDKGIQMIPRYDGFEIAFLCQNCGELWTYPMRD
jgi:hypothetical protein